MPDIRKVIISSTALDLPEHRKQVMDACLRQGMFPTMMEHMPASDTEAISASLELVDEATFTSACSREPQEACRRGKGCRLL